MFKLFVIASLVSVCLGVSVQFHDCGSTATVESLVIEPCPHDPCHVRKGVTYTGNITIVPHEKSTTATNEALGVVVTVAASTTESFNQLEKNACTQGLSCPLVPGVRQTYHPTVTVPSDVLTPTRWIAKWKLNGDHRSTIVCVSFPITIDG